MDKLIKHQNIDYPLETSKVHTFLSLSCKQTLPATSCEQPSQDAEFAKCSQVSKSTIHQKELKYEDKSTTKRNIIAESNADVPYKCVICNIKIEHLSEIDAHLKTCQTAYGGLHMNDDGPQLIACQEQLTRTLVSAFFVLTE